MQSSFLLLSFLSHAPLVSSLRLIVSVSSSHHFPSLRGDREHLSDLASKIADLNKKVASIRQEQQFQREVSWLEFALSSRPPPSTSRGSSSKQLTLFYPSTFSLWSLCSSFARLQTEAMFRDLSEVTNSRAVWWSALQILVIIATCYWQTKTLRVSLL